MCNSGNKSWKEPRLVAAAAGPGYEEDIIINYLTFTFSYLTRSRLCDCSSIE
jgi:hypothetical protein